MWADWELAGEAWSHPSLLRWWPVMRRSRVLVLLIPATVLTHSSPAPHTGGSNQPTAFYCFLSAQTWSFIILYISTGLETSTNLWSLGIYCFRRQTETLSHGFRDLWSYSSPVMYCRPQSPGSSFAMQISQNRTPPASFLLIERSLYLQDVLSCK